MSDGSVRSVMGSALTALPWCCIAPAAFAVSGVATAGIGTGLQSALPVFLFLSAGFLGRSLLPRARKAPGPDLGARCGLGARTGDCTGLGVSVRVGRPVIHERSN